LFHAKLAKEQGRKEFETRRHEGAKDLKHEDAKTQRHKGFVKKEEANNWNLITNF
jgi:hypothetical protein